MQRKPAQGKSTAWLAGCHVAIYDGVPVEVRQGGDDLRCPEAGDGLRSERGGPLGHIGSTALWRWGVYGEFMGNPT